MVCENFSHFFTWFFAFGAFLLACAKKLAPGIETWGELFF